MVEVKVSDALLDAKAYLIAHPTGTDNTLKYILTGASYSDGWVYEYTYSISFGETSPSLTNSPANATDLENYINALIFNPKGLGASNFDSQRANYYQEITNFSGGDAEIFDEINIDPAKYQTESLYSFWIPIDKTPLNEMSGIVRKVNGQSETLSFDSSEFTQISVNSTNYKVYTVFSHASSYVLDNSEASAISFEGVPN